MTPDELQFLASKAFAFPSLASAHEAEVGALMFANTPRRENFIPPSENRKWVIHEQGMRKAQQAAAKKKRIAEAIASLGDEFIAAEFAAAANYTTQSASVQEALKAQVREGVLTREKCKTGRTRGYLYRKTESSLPRECKA